MILGGRVWVRWVSVLHHQIIRILFISPFLQSATSLICSSNTAHRSVPFGQDFSASPFGILYNICTFNYLKAHFRNDSTNLIGDPQWINSNLHSPSLFQSLPPFPLSPCAVLPVAVPLLFPFPRHRERCGRVPRWPLRPPAARRS